MTSTYVDQKARTSFITLVGGIVLLITSVTYKYREVIAFKDHGSFRIQNLTIKDRNDDCRLMNSWTFHDEVTCPDDVMTYPDDIVTCPIRPSATLLHSSLSYLLPDLQATESRVREPEQDASAACRIKFLPDYSNPCWVEELPTNPYTFPSAEYIKFDVPHDLLREARRKMLPLFRRRQNTTVSPYRNNTRMRCLPYIFLLGTHKSGSTDFYQSLLQHPLVVAGEIKEPQIFSQLPANLSSNLSSNPGANPVANMGMTAYLDLYDSAAEEIRQSRDAGGHHPKVTIDASAHNYQGYSAHWAQHPWHRLAGKQCITVAHHLRYYSPRSKYILLFRNPLRWVVSCWTYYQEWKPYRNHRHSVRHVRRFVLKQVADVRKCLQNVGDPWYCSYKLAGDERCHPALMLYQVYARHWIKVVGAENIIIINSDEYFRDRRKFLARTFRFLNLTELSEENFRMIRDRKPSNSADKPKVVFDNFTLSVLQEFVQPWNDKLAELLDDPSFRWSSEL